MMDFDELQELERARVEEDEEEFLKNEVEKEAQTTLELEAEAQKRLQKQVYEEQGKPGVLFMVTIADSSMFFCDAVNKALRPMKKLFDSEGQRLVGIGGKMLERRVEIIVVFLNFLIWNYFPDEDATAAIFQRIANSFHGENGLRALLQLWLSDTQASHRRGSLGLKSAETMAVLDRELKHILACTRRLLAAIVEPTVVWTKEWLVERYRDTLAVMFPKTPPPLSGRWHEQGLDLPVEDEVELVVQCSGESETSRMLIMGGAQKLQDLQAHLVVQHGLPTSVQLFGSGRALNVSQNLRSAPALINVQGVGKFRHCTESALDGARELEWLQWWRSLAMFKIFKPTAIMSTRILFKLRDHFTEKQFQARYSQLKKVADSGAPHNEAHQELLGMTWNVQKRILPEYGYEASPSGLQEMRNDVMKFAGFDIWHWAVDDHNGPRADQVVWKVRKDIHYVLDMGGKLPAFQSQNFNMSVGDAWLLWAKLIANYDTSCFRAARLISNADIFLLCTGAGFSADSGLAVYADVAKVRAYKQRSLEYSDLCNTWWLREEPELFWGFWGQCYNDYRETAPHEGFSIISSWVDRFFRKTAIAHKVRNQLAAKSSKAPPSFAEPYAVNDYAGAFFVFTSNVDTHHFDWFRAAEIRECHGNTELFQCSGLNPSGRHCERVWRSPRRFTFHIDKDNMLAPKESPMNGDQAIMNFAGTWRNVADGQKMTIAVQGNWATILDLGVEGYIVGKVVSWSGNMTGQQSTLISDRQLRDYNGETWELQGNDRCDTQDDASDHAHPHITKHAVGNVRGGGRPDAFRYLPDPPDQMRIEVEQGFRSNHPQCPFCRAPARPAIMMFEDKAFRDVSSQRNRWQDWQATVLGLIREASGIPVQAVILEIGAGNRVPTVRINSEQQLRVMRDAGANAHLIRVNPELPLGDAEEFAPNGQFDEFVLSIIGGGLKTIQRINATMPQ